MNKLDKFAFIVENRSKML